MSGDLLGFHPNNLKDIHAEDQPRWPERERRSSKHSCQAGPSTAAPTTEAPAIAGGTADGAEIDHSGIAEEKGSAARKNRLRRHSE
jgi:hypothetical protein